MWVLVMGSVGTTKRTIANYLADAQGLTYMREDVPGSQGFDGEFDYFTQRLEMHRFIQKRMHSKDFITVRSLWDQMGVMLPFSSGDLSEREKIQRGFLDRLWNQLKDDLKPPTAVIYLRASKITSYNRLALTNSSIHEDDWDRMNSLYEDFIQSIAVPLIEVEADQPFDKIKAQLDFDIESVKTARFADETIWSRSFYKGVY